MDEDAGPAADWPTLGEHLRWCLVDGRGVDGRDVMFSSLQMKDLARGQAGLRSGFMMSFRDDAAPANYLACAREDALRVFNLGRSTVGLKPVEAA